MFEPTPNFYLILLLVNFSHELAHIMITYDFLSARQMFEPSLTLPDFTFGQPLI